MTTYRRFAIALATVVFASLNLAAQESPGLIFITRVKLKPDMVESYKKIVKDEAMPAYKKTDIEWIDTWEVWPFGDGPEIIFATEMKSFAVFDDPHPLLKVLGAEGTAALLKKLRQHAVSINTSIYRFEKDLSVRTDSAAETAVLWEADVTPGNLDRARHWIKTELKPAMEKSGVVNCLMHSEIFGTNPDLMAVVMQKNFAQLDKGHPVLQAYGAAEAGKVMARGESLFESSRVITLRHLPDLSFDKTK